MFLYNEGGDNMSGVHGNPEELRAFAGALQQYLENVGSETAALNNAFEHLGDTWQDEKRVEFEDTYRELIHALDNFQQNASDQLPHLYQLAQRLEDYLRT